MSLMIEKFKKDFIDANEILKAIDSGEITHEYGIKILDKYIGYVRKDISTLDKDAKNQLNEIRLKFDKISEEKKEKERKRYPVPEDSIEKRTLDLKLMEKDLEKLHHELEFIQDLGYEKGWLD